MYLVNFYWDALASIIGKILLALIYSLDIHLLLLCYLLLKDDLLHVSATLHGFVGWLVALLLLFALFFQLELLRFLLLANLILSLLVFLDFFLDLCDKLRMQFLLPLYHSPQPLNLMLDFLHSWKDTVMPFFMIFSLAPSMFS